MFFSPSKHREEKSITGKNSSSFLSREEKKPSTPREREAATTPPSCTDAAEAMTPRSDQDKEREKDEKEKEEQPEDLDFDTGLHRMSQEIDRFLDGISDAKKKEEEELSTLEIPDCFQKFTKIVEDEIAKYDSGKNPGKWSQEMGEEEPLLKAIDKVSKLTDSLGSFTSQPKYSSSLDRISSLQQRAMLFLEDEFRSLLEDTRTGDQGSVYQKTTTKQSSFKSKEEPDRCVIPIPEPASARSSGGEEAAYSPETISKLNQIASTMISAGYATECCQVYSIVRRTDFEESLSKIGFEKISIDDIQKMSWESLEGQIATWNQVCRKCISVSFSSERNLSNSVFSTSHAISDSLSSNLIRGIVIQLLNFAEAVAMTKKSAEKLFKFLDIYEALRDLVPILNDLFPGDSSPELKSETALAKSRIGEVAVTIFSDLENSIKSDNGKTPVPGGAVHPLTRYVMNYLKYACEYHDTLEEVFQQHKKPDTSPESDAEELATNSLATKQQNVHNQTQDPSPFSVQLMAVMDLLDTNLEAKSKLYKDLSLSYIFLMNNGRYIMQKIKGSREIYGLMGDTWCRKRSSDLRNYHKNYTRETWGKVLNCFKEEGLQQSKGYVSKPQLKERFKSFNAIFEEIHKTQSSWVVSDEQLQSELRVSISAVVVPAYRSFLARYRQHLDPGRQTEKYIKVGPEELETFIDELFDGTPASMVRRRT